MGEIDTGENGRIIIDGNIKEYYVKVFTMISQK